MMNTKRDILVRHLLSLLILFLITTWIGKEAEAWNPKNTVGIKVGYFRATQLKELYPLTALSLEDIDDAPPFLTSLDNIVQSVYYSRQVVSFLHFDVDLGFRAERDLDSSYEHLYLIWPLSFSVMYDFPVLHFYKMAVGGGLDYWMFQEEIWQDKTFDAVSGYHVKFAMKYRIYTAELIYSKIDRFGGYPWDLGGITANVGLFHRF